MAKKVPVNEVLKLSKQGYTDADIIRYLREEGYKPTEINDAMNQAKIKLELAGMAGMEAEITAPMPSEYAEAAKEEMAPSIMAHEAAAPEAAYYPTEAPTEASQAPLAETPEGYPYTYPTYPAAAPAPTTESMEEIAEEIINEKWREFVGKVGDVVEFRRYIESRMKSIEDRIRRLEQAFDKLQAATMEKVREYGRDVKALGTEIQALEGAFGKVVEPLSTSVKELRELSEEMKKTKRAKLTKLKSTKPKKPVRRKK